MIQDKYDGDQHSQDWFAVGINLKDNKYYF